MPSPNLVLMSGGLMSAALAFELRSLGKDFTCLHVGHTATRAWEAVEQIAHVLDRPAQCVQMPVLEEATGTRLTTQAVPSVKLKHWSTLVCVAMLVGGPDTHIWGGWSKVDQKLPDATDGWLEVVRFSKDGLIKFSAPYLFKPADLVIGECVANHGQDVLKRAYSCDNGLSGHCGQCPSCHHRKELFRLAGALDPTEYAVQEA